MTNEKENKNQQKTEEQQQEQTKQPGFWERTWARYKRDLRDVVIGAAFGAFVTYEVLTARSKKAAEETVEDQETEEEEEDVLEVSDE